MINNDWEFCVSDHPFLRSYSEAPQGLDIAFYEENGLFDHSTGDFRFKTWLANDVDDHDEAWQIGYELTELFNSVSTLLAYRRPAIILEQVRSNGRKRQWAEKADFFGVLHWRCQGLQDERHTKDIAVNETAKLIDLAKSNDALYLILKYFAMPQNWVTLYKALETLEHLAKKDGIDLQISDSDRTAFANSANNYSIVGIESRHGLKGSTKENRKKSTQIVPARELIRVAAVKYLKQSLGLK